VRRKLEPDRVAVGSDVRRASAGDPPVSQAKSPAVTDSAMQRPGARTESGYPNLGRRRQYHEHSHDGPRGAGSTRDFQFHRG